MLAKLLLSIGASLAIAAPQTGESNSLSNWIPVTGDKFIVDVNQNIGYLFHTNGAFVTFPVVTGQQRVVAYIGRTYYAGTPAQAWTVQSIDNKSDDTVTFGPTGMFLRLSRDGVPSPYGIHSHRDADKMLADPSDKRYRSMGCIIVSEQILTLIETTYHTNGNTLSVLTEEGSPMVQLAKQ